MDRPMSIASTLLALLLLAPALAHAWRTSADGPDLAGATARWQASSIEVALTSRTPDGLPPSDVVAALGRALATVSGAGCGPSLSMRTATLANTVAGDGIIAIDTLSSAEWAARGYELDAAATTSVLYRQRSGGWEVADAEIHLNGAYTWTIGDAGQDLEAALAHELLHALGLLHCCELDGAGGAPICGSDPACDAALLYPIHRGADHRALAADDRSGLCALYSSDCPLACTLDECADGACALCATDADCAPSERCEGRCVATSSPPCATDADCAAGRLCVDGSCGPGLALGDPCERSVDCDSGICASGTCASTCGAGDYCPLGFGCTEGLCVVTSGAFGDSCRYMRDCAGGACLTGDDLAPVCTRSCEDARPCPSGWQCGQADGRDVCVPASAPPSCAAAPGRSGRTPLLLCLSILGMLQLRRRLRC